MKVKQFIEEFEAKKIQNTKVNEHAVSQYLRNTLEIKHYLPFAEKRELCVRVLNACNTRENSGFVKVDSVARYITFTLFIISAYTNLEFSAGENNDFDALDEYDMLCRADLLNPILNEIGGEYTTCNNLLNMMMSDIVENNNTIENIIGMTISKFGDSLDNLIAVIADKVESMELDLSQIDIDKYQGVLDLIPKK